MVHDDTEANAGDDAHGTAEDPTESRLHGIARGFLKTFGGEGKAQELDDEIERMAPSGATAEGLDALVSAGLAVGASRAEIRRSMAEHDAAAEGPLVHAREVERDGQIAIRLFIDAPPADVDVFRGQKSVLIRTPAGEVEERVGFDPATVEQVANEESGVAEYLIAPPAEQTVVNAEIESESDTDTENEGEDGDQ